MTVEQIEHLLRRYGSLATEVLEIIAENPSLARPVAGAPGYPQARLLRSKP